jgi:hypothetical protein
MKKPWTHVVRAVWVMLIVSAATEGRMPPAEMETRIEGLLAQMTLAEKVSLCHGHSKFNTAGIPRLGIPRIEMTDGPHGVRRETEEHSWAPVGREDDYVTYLPTGSALAATWNPALARLYGETLGAEARHRGKDIILGPGVNIVRTPGLRPQFRISGGRSLSCGAPGRRGCARHSASRCGGLREALRAEQSGMGPHGGQRSGG